MHLPAAQVVRDVVTYRRAISIRGIRPAAAAEEPASDMQRQRRALIDDRQPRLTWRAPRLRALPPGSLSAPY